VRSKRGEARRLRAYDARVPRSVLVLVDPDVLVQRAMTSVANDAGFELLPCNSARDGLDACSAIDAACLVTELRLPREDGLWLLAAVRAEPRTTGLPIAMVGTDIERRILLGALDAGADLVVAKPFSAVELVAQLRALVRMVARVRRRAPAASGPDTVRDAATAFGIAVPPAAAAPAMPIATLVGGPHLASRTGTIRIRPAGEPYLDLEIVDGALVGGHRDGKRLDAATARRQALGLSSAVKAGGFTRLSSTATTTVARLLLEVLQGHAIATEPRPLRAPPESRDTASRPAPARSPPPPQRTTLMSQKAAPTEAAPRRRSSGRIRAAISVDDRTTAPEESEASTPGEKSSKPPGRKPGSDR
jgi:CheY-like chemotaxis protein